MRKCVRPEKTEERIVLISFRKVERALVNIVSVVLIAQAELHVKFTVYRQMTLSTQAEWSEIMRCRWILESNSTIAECSHVLLVFSRGSRISTSLEIPSNERTILVVRKNVKIAAFRTYIHSYTSNHCHEVWISIFSDLKNFVFKF